MAKSFTYDEKGKVKSCRVRACLGRDDNEKQVWITKTFYAPLDMKPKATLDALNLQIDNWIAEQKKQYERGVDPRAKERFKYYAENIFWTSFVVSSNQHHKGNTKEFYRNMMPRIINYFGDKLLAKVTPKDVNKFYCFLRDDEGLSESTIKHYQTTLRTMFGFAVKKKLLPYDRNPMLEADIIKQKSYVKVEFLNPEEVTQFINALDAVPLRWRCMMQIMICTGLRRGETVGLQWQDIDTENNLIYVRRSVSYIPKPKEKTDDSGKTFIEQNISKLKEGKDYGIIIDTVKGRSEDDLPDTVNLDSNLKAIIESWKREQKAEFGTLLPTAYLFPSVEDAYKPMHPDSVYRWLQRFWKKNGLPRVYPHMLRHTVGSLMISNNATVKQTQEQLRHRSPTVTVRNYVGATNQEVRRANENFIGTYIFKSENKDATNATKEA